MIEKRPIANLIGHLMLILGIIIVAFPIYYTFVASTMTSAEILRPPISLLPGGHFAENYGEALNGGVERVVGVSLERMLWNTLVVAVVIAAGKIAISFLSAFAIVFFRFPLRMVFFWMIFVTLMLPVEVRMLPTYKVIVDLGMIDTYAGLTLPLMASALRCRQVRELRLPPRRSESGRKTFISAIYGKMDGSMPRSACKPSNWSEQKAMCMGCFQTRKASSFASQGDRILLSTKSVISRPIPRRCICFPQMANGSHEKCLDALCTDNRRYHRRPRAGDLHIPGVSKTTQ